MNFTIKTSELKKAMKLSKAIDASDVSVSAYSNVVSFCFCDKDIMLKTEHPCDVILPGEGVIPLAILNASKGFDGSDVLVSSDGGLNVVQCGFFKASDVANNPASCESDISAAAVEFEMMKTPFVGTAALTRAVSVALLAAGSKELNPMKNGVLFDVRNNNTLNVVGLCKDKLAADVCLFPSIEECASVIPLSAAKTLLAVLKSCPDTEIKFGVSADLVGCVFSGVELYIRPVKEGKIPEGRGALDFDDDVARINVEASRLSSALKLLKASKCNPVDIHFDGIRLLTLSSIGDRCRQQISVHLDGELTGRQCLISARVNDLLSLFKPLKMLSSLSVSFYGNVKDRAELLAVRPGNNSQFPVLFLKDALPEPKDEVTGSQE